MFVNSIAFNNPKSRMQALGTDTRHEKAVVNLSGQPYFYPQTGGMIHPQRHELQLNTILYRFVASDTPVDRAVVGGWWMEHSEFAKVCSFAQQQGTSVAMAARLLCCVPAEWSNMGMLVRAAVREPLLAYRGLGNNVNIPHDDDRARVKMTAHNTISARRLYQLFIPGLYDQAQRTRDRVVAGVMSVEQTWAIKKEEANKGWLYLP